MSNDLITIKQPENWIHYSEYPDQIVMLDKPQQDEDCGIWSKPKGLWITPEYAENNWFQWCMNENFRKAQLNFVHDVKLNSDANLLRIENAVQLDQFTKQYLNKTENRHEAWICWERVASEYDGILIPNYIWERRLFRGTDWYYSWDCASGCIWNASAVESITLRSTVSAGYVTREFDMKKKMAEATELIEQLEKDGV